MIIEKTKDGLKITHPTGVVQIISKAELISIIAERDNIITEMQAEKNAFQNDVDDIDVLIAK